MPDQSAEYLQRVGFFAFVPALLQRMGVDPGQVIAAAGLPPDALHDPDSSIPFRNVGLLMQEASDRTNCPHFGLELGKLIKPSSLGLLGQLVSTAPTLRHAMKIFAAHQHRNSHAHVVYLVESEAEAFLGCAVYASDVIGNHLFIDTVAMGMFTAINELVDGAALSMEIYFSRSQPANVSVYRRFFGVGLNFDAEQTAIRIPLRNLDQPVRGADAKKFSELEVRVQNVHHAGLLSTEASLRRELRLGLLTGNVSAPQIAARLGMNTRMLHRRLQKTGLTFQRALDEARSEFVRQLLTNTRLDINTIGSIVGYSDPSVLTHSFTRWTGMSPHAWRSRLTTDLHRKVSASR